MTTLTSIAAAHSQAVTAPAHTGVSTAAASKKHQKERAKKKNSLVTIVDTFSTGKTPQESMLSIVLLLQSLQTRLQKLRKEEAMLSAKMHKIRKEQAESILKKLEKALHPKSREQKALDTTNHLLDQVEKALPFLKGLIKNYSDPKPAAKGDILGSIGRFFEGAAHVAANVVNVMVTCTVIGLVASAFLGPFALAACVGLGIYVSTLLVLKAAFKADTPGIDQKKVASLESELMQMNRACIEFAKTMRKQMKLIKKQMQAIEANIAELEKKEKNEHHLSKVV